MVDQREADGHQLGRPEAAIVPNIAERASSRSCRCHGSMGALSSGQTRSVQARELGYSAEMVQTVIAGDFGGTNLRAALVSDAGEILVRREIRTPADLPPEEILTQIAALLESVKSSDAPAPGAACIAVAGLINAETGTVMVSPNIPTFRNLVLTTPVAEAIGVPTHIENDASAAALGEFRFGAGRGARHTLHATLGTGIGGGIVIDGRLYRGAKGLAGEIGHVVLDPTGPPCPCGSRGCLEAIVSGVAFARRAQRLLDEGKAPVLTEIAAGRAPTATDLFAAATRGEAASAAEIQNGGHFLGLGFGGLVNVLNPDVVTLSGGLLGMGDLLLQPLREAMASLAYGPATDTPVRTSELGEDAGLFGAAAVALERLS